MNRADFQEIAEARLREAQTLLKGEHYDGAYYLAGYVVECALKACIAKQTRQYDFPDKARVSQSYTHKLEDLLQVAELQPLLKTQSKEDEALRLNWAIVKDWTADSRYERKSKRAAEDLHKAVADSEHGVFPWLRRHW